MNNIPSMIFIVGNSRSGTTMLSRILGQHSAIFALHELHFIENKISPDKIINGYIPQEDEAQVILSTLLRAERNGIYSKNNINQYQVEAKNILKTCENNLSSMEIFRCFCTYEAKKHQKKIPCEQTPKNIYYVNEILKVLPNSKFIHMYRDPRDILLSQKLKWKRRFLGAEQVPLFRETLRAWLNYHPIITSKLWVSAINQSVIHTHDNSENFLNVQFEGLLNDPNRQIKRICDFLNIDFQGNMSNVPQIGSSSGKDKTQQYGIDKSRQNNWNNGSLTKGEIGICQSICGLEMNRLGYKKVKIEGLWFWWGLYGFTFFFKMGGALLFNLKRTKNLYSTIKRRLDWGKKN